MAAPDRPASYYGNPSNEFYSSSFDDYQNDIDQSLDFEHVPSTDFYLGPEMFLIPQMLGEQPYPAQHVFTGMAPLYEQQQAQSHCPRSSSDALSNQAQLSSRAHDESPRQLSVEPRKSVEYLYNYHTMGGRYYEHDHEGESEHSSKRRRPSEDKKPRTPSIPHANVFKLDLRIPPVSQAEAQPIASQESLSSVFEVNVSQQPKRKARSSFTPQGKRKVEAVRSVGACIQCKFRKRTVIIMNYAL